MITQLIQKQIDKELEFIYLNLPSFIYTFIPRYYESYEDCDFFFAMASDFLYAQIHYHDQDGMLCFDEDSVDFEDYNAWCNNVNNGGTDVKTPS